MAFHIIRLATLLACSLDFVLSVPMFGIRDTESHAAVSTLSSEQTDMLVRPARLSQIAYCSSASVLSWRCGSSCDALSGMKPIVAGGDDGEIPRYYIAYDRVAQSIVIAHQGTDPENILSIANDIQVGLAPLDKSLFPNVNSNIQTHDGFAKTFARTANEILGNVTTALKSNSVGKVEIYGHSLGAAIAVMDAVFLRQHLNPSVSISTTVFGLPRSGNQDWANFVDQRIPGLMHIHNKKDPIGIVPPRRWGYQHPSGEIHIQASGSSLDCPGQENQDSKCLAGQSLLDFSINDHYGPYYGSVSIGSSFCP